jgi:hypothetical protein
VPAQVQVDAAGDQGARVHDDALWVRRPAMTIPGSRAPRRALH